MILNELQLVMFNFCLINSPERDVILALEQSKEYLSIMSVLALPS